MKAQPLKLPEGSLYEALLMDLPTPHTRIYLHPFHLLVVLAQHCQLLLQYLGYVHKTHLVCWHVSAFHYGIFSKLSQGCNILKNKSFSSKSKVEDID